jgi:CubicO group peptidase (beta-lactamase class C family)
MSFEKSLNQYMAEEIKAGRHVGLALATFRNGKDRYFNYGTSSGADLTEENYFEIASLSKVFTSILILRLEDEGYFSLEDNIDSYFPEFGKPGQATIASLLTHTSGLEREPANFQFIAPQNSYSAYTDQMLLDDLKSVALNIGNIGRFSYSNYGYILLGLLARRVTGNPKFSSLLSEKVLDPLGLSEMRFELTGEQKEKICLGHTENLEPVEPYMDLGETFSSAGALIATTKELLNACKLFLAPNLIDIPLRNPVQRLFRIAPDKDGSPISLGFHIRKVEDEVVFYHAGDIAGHKCCFMISPKRNEALAYNTSTLSHVRNVWDLFFEEHD